MQPSVRYNTSAERYEILLDGEPVGYAEAEDDGAQVVLPHTEVQPRFQGRGLAAVLVGYALEDIRTQGRSVVPACSYVRHFIDRHPEYADLVA